MLLAKGFMFMLMQQDMISLMETGQKTRILQLRTSKVLKNLGIKRASSAFHFDASIVLDFRYITCKVPRSRISASEWLGDFHSLCYYCMGGRWFLETGLTLS